jgi:tRNA(Ile)-lysidine synthase
MKRISEIEKLVSRVRRFIQQKGLVKEGERWLVGVSGGPDSVCLLHLLCQMRNELGVSIHAVHLHHGLRGKEADGDAEYVGRLAARLGISFTVGKKDVMSFRQEHRCSVEEAAREVRYLFFSDEALSVQAQKVALAHTADDQAETILLHLLWGAGSRGLKGMAPIENWRSPVTGASITVVRPLLEVTRSETEAYCQACDLQPREDTTNRSPRFLRNRIRAEVLPLLKNLNPRIRETLGRTAELISQEQTALEALAATLAKKLLKRDGERVLVDIKGMQAQSPGLQRFLLRLAWALLKGDLRNLEAQHIEKMRLLLGQKTGKKIHLPGSVVLQREYDKVIFSHKLEITPPLLVPAKLTVPGEVDAMGYHFCAHISSSHGAPNTGGDSHRAYMDAEVGGRELIIRARQPGDRFQPLGMIESKKLQDFMVDAHIPQQIRSRIPIVCSAGHILWVVGWRLDERAKVTDATTEVLVLEASPLNPEEDVSPVV